MARLGDRMGLRGRKELVAKRDRRNGVRLASGLGTWVGGQRPPEGTRLVVGVQELGLKYLRDTPVEQVARTLGIGVEFKSERSGLEKEIGIHESCDVTADMQSSG